MLELVFHGDRQPVRAHRVIVGIGRSGDFRKLGVPGEGLDKVYNRLHDPMAFAGKDALVVGGGDSAMETAIALATRGANVTLSYRKAEFSRPKPENVEKIGELTRNQDSLRLMMSSRVRQIDDGEVVITNADGRDATLRNDVVFTMIGREPPLDFFRRSGVHIRGEWRPATWLTLGLMLAVCTFIYHWKKGGVWLPIQEVFVERNWFPFNVSAWWAGLGTALADTSTLLGTMKVTVGRPDFYYSLAYCLLMVVFGIRRVRRRRTPYVKRQTLTLVAIQLLPLFILPYLLLPWMGNNGWFDGGAAGWLADQLFPVVNYGHGREYWRAFGFILAWPLLFVNVFTHEPLGLWLAISFAQTFVVIPWLVRCWGKGAYCGWICSCGGMAETLGDAHRHKMPHGPGWNRLNMIGQLFLALAMVLLVTRCLSWIRPGSFFGEIYESIMHGLPGLNYAWFVDLFWAGIIGFGCYFHFSGRVWCRFACPLAALMHIYARFSRFRIFADKKKCISCNVCTAVCHQGIDIMDFANKGMAMEDPQCVRCSACVQSCPTGVLSFGRLAKDGRPVLDCVAASPVQIAEST